MCKKSVQPTATADGRPCTHPNSNTYGPESVPLNAWTAQGCSQRWGAAVLPFQRSARLLLDSWSAALLALCAIAQRQLFRRKGHLER